MFTESELTEYVATYRARCAAPRHPGMTVHDGFPEVSDPVSQEVAAVLVMELAEYVSNGTDAQTLFQLAINAMHMGMAWGYGLGALSMADIAAVIPTTPDNPGITDDPDPSVRDWRDTIGEVGGNDWLE